MTGTIPETSVVEIEAVQGVKLIVKKKEAIVIWEVFIFSGCHHRSSCGYWHPVSALYRRHMQ